MSDGHNGENYGGGEVTTEQAEAWLKGVLSEVYIPEGVEIFWNNPHTFLEGRSPAEVIKTDPAKVVKLVHHMRDL